MKKQFLSLMTLACGVLGAMQEPAVVEQVLASENIVVQASAAPTDGAAPAA